MIFTIWTRPDRYG
uniref:Uncharacterized protein n=1 Tax=Lepeophtheirus salmonis TaxID=72036 RepID=A0A0K2U1J0_LEPSM